MPATCGPGVDSTAYAAGGSVTTTVPASYNPAVTAALPVAGSVGSSGPGPVDPTRHGIVPPVPPVSSSANHNAEGLGVSHAPPPSAVSAGPSLGLDKTVGGGPPMPPTGASVTVPSVLPGVSRGGSLYPPALSATSQSSISGGTPPHAVGSLTNLATGSSGGQVPPPEAHSAASTNGAVGSPVPPAHGAASIHGLTPPVPTPAHGNSIAPLYGTGSAPPAHGGLQPPVSAGASAPLQGPTIGATHSTAPAGQPSTSQVKPGAWNNR